MRSEVSTAVKIKSMVLRDMAPYSLVPRHQHTEQAVSSINTSHLFRKVIGSNPGWDSDYPA
jgi:hypothetical protein